MRVTHRRRRLAFTLLSLSIVAGCTASEAASQGKRPTETDKPPATGPAPVEPAGNPVTLDTASGRQSPAVIAAGGRDAPYNYAPSVLVDGNRFRMWWCSQLGIANPPGDDILLAESRNLNGPFVGPDGTGGTPVLSGSAARFDAMHTCDPSVLKVGGTYYMYYTGAAGDHAHGNAIGLATSTDGRVWTRANGGKPIVTAARHVKNSNTYGAGQPSVVYLAGLFYLMFTDTTGQDTGHNGAGQFILRSTDPTFTRNIEALTDAGFKPVADTSARVRSVVDAFSADWMWVDALATFAIAHETRDGTTITFWDWNFSRNPYRPLLVPGVWREGPGLVRRSDGHAVVSLDNPCGTVAIDLVRATEQAPAGPSSLRHFGLNVVGFDACREPGRAVLALDGFAMPSPQNTIDLVVGGKVVRIDRRSVAEKLAIRILDRRVPALDQVKLAAHITPGIEARQAPGRGAAFLVDNQLLRIGSAAVADLNSSAALTLRPEQWDAYARGVDLVGPPR